MNVKMKRYLKALVAFVLAFAMVSEAWGGISFVSKAETSESEVNAVAETVDLTSVPEFPTKSETEWASEELPTGDSYKLSSEDAFVSFARASRAHTFEGKVVYLNTDFTYTKGAFGGIGDIDTKKVSFQGTFDGQNHKISNMVVGTKGIFASIKGATIKNLVIDNATMPTSGNAQRGLLVSKAYNISGDPNIADRSIVIDGITITDSSMTANYAQSGLIVGRANNTFPIRNCTIKNSTMNCTRTAVDATAVSGYGLVVGYAVQKVDINKVKVVDSAINFDEKSWVSNVGGFVGYIGNGGSITNSSINNSKETPVISGSFAQEETANPNQKPNVTVGNTGTGWLIDGLDPDKAKISENIGGVIGYVSGVFNAQDVEVDNTDISMKNVLKNVGGFAGYVSWASATEKESTFTNCSVKDANITSTQFIWDPGYKKENGVYVELSSEEKHYYHNIAGFVACVDKKATFTECSVDNTVTQTQTRYRCGGGLIGSTFSYKNNSEGLPSKGIINVSKCSVTRTTIKTGNSRNCNVGGGLVALLAEGSTVTDCYVYDYANADNRNSLYMGGLIGDVYDIQKGSLANGKTVVKNCYVGKAHIQGFNFVGEVIGDTDDGVDLKGFSNLLYCKTDTKITRNLDRDNPSIATFDAVKGKAHDVFSNRELAYTMNAGGSDGNAMSDIWTQGPDGYPIFGDGTQKPIRKVVFQAEGRSYAYFTNAEGKLDEYPNPDDGYQWLGFSPDQVFTENTWIYQAPAKMSITDYVANKDLETDFYITTKEELLTFRDLAKSNTFKGKTIHLMADIDLAGVNWSGIGTSSYPFGGTFDGHGFSIKNLSSGSHGLFLYLGYAGNKIIAQPTIKNLTIDHADVTGDNGTAVVVARIMGNPKNSSLNSQILNVHVTNSTVKCPKSNAAIIAGRNESSSGDAITISGCTVTNCTVKCTATEYPKKSDNTKEDILNYAFILGRDISEGYSRIIGCTVTDSEIISDKCTILQVGGVVGYSNGPTHIEECTLEGCTISCAPDKTVPVSYIGGVVGRFQSNHATLTDCTVNDTSFNIDAVAIYVGGVVGGFAGGKIQGNKVNNTIINLNYVDEEKQSGVVGGVVGSIGLLDSSSSLPKIEVSKCEAKNVTINVASIGAYAIGGLIGRSSKYISDVSVKDSLSQNVKITSTYSATEVPGAYSFGGAIGHVQAKANVKNVTVEGIQMTSKKAYRAAGGFVGLVQGTQPSTFENCKVTAYKNGNTTISSSIYENKGGNPANWDDYSFHVGGFAGLVVSNSTFTSCMVDNMDVYMRERVRGFGGIVGSVFDIRTTVDGNTEDKTAGSGVLTINRCTSSNVTYSSGGASYFIGGIVGALSEGSTVTNCLVSGFSHSSTGSNNVGAVVGRLYETSDDDNVIAVMKNCYIQNCNISVQSTAGILMGGCVANKREAKNNYYYNTTLAVTTTDANNLGQQYNFCTEVTDASILTNKKLAYNLNTTNGTEPHNGSWAQGATNPIIADEKNAAVAYVTYLRYNGNEGYAGMEYLVFPINPDGSINYSEGTRKFIRQDKITDKSQVNRQTLTNGEAAQEEIDLSKNHYKEVWVEQPCSYSGEPEPNGGRIWQYPEGKITSDVTITQIEKTAWDYNGDTKLSVSDLVRMKKSEKANYNSNTCKASKIGSMYTNNKNSTYIENQEGMSEDGYLPSYRLRRVILTPPSTTVSVLSYNLYYESKNDLIPDEVRQDTIREMLGLDRPKDNVTLSTRGEYEDNTKPKADIIALQEVTADFWHDTIYREYLAPYQYGTDGVVSEAYKKDHPDATASKNGKIDPSEVTSKEYYTFEHFGRGRYGHVFYNESGNAFNGDSYTLLLYNRKKYSYKSGDSGTIYLSDTPTVASHGWGNDIPHTSELLDSQRAANWAIFKDKTTGEPFMFVNIHLSHSEEGKDRQPVRMKQIELILRRVKEILGQESRKYGLGEASGGMPIIIAGDFNSYLGADAYSYALEQGYMDARETASASTEKHGAFNNWTTTDPSKYSYGDHFLVNDRARVQTYEVIDGDETDTGDSHIEYSLYNDKYHYSDHCPIRATIDIGSDYIRSTTEEINGYDYLEVYGYK